MSDWLQGEVARVSVQIADVAGLAADPATVTLKIKSPSGTLVTRNYPGQITRTAAGVYQCDVVLTEKGRWLWRWETDAPAPGACQGSLAVSPSNI